MSAVWLIPDDTHRSPPLTQELNLSYQLLRRSKALSELGESGFRADKTSTSSAVLKNLVKPST
jgi:hypothetical protein